MGFMVMTSLVSVITVCMAMASLVMVYMVVFSFCGVHGHGLSCHCVQSFTLAMVSMELASLGMVFKFMLSV
jgi:hypothetical protein